MATIRLPRDFKEFLKLLDANKAKFLMVGGYAVNFHGYARTTGGLDLWVGLDESNAERVAASLRDFGFPQTSSAMFSRPDQIIRIGVPPIRLEVMTTTSGVDFDDCWVRRETATIDELQVPVIRLDDLRINKRSAGRSKDLADLDELGHE